MVMEEDEETNNVITHHDLLRNRMAIQNNVVNKRKVDSKKVYQISKNLSNLELLLVREVGKNEREVKEGRSESTATKRVVCKNNAE